MKKMALIICMILACGSDGNKESLIGSKECGVIDLTERSCAETTLESPKYDWSASDINEYMRQCIDDSGDPEKCECILSYVREVHSSLADLDAGGRCYYEEWDASAFFVCAQNCVEGI